MFRSVPFVDRLAIPISGNVTNNAICLGDCDNDGRYELCVGNSLGNLSIFKDLNEEPWKKQNNLGHIVAISCGDLCNQGKNVLALVSADGHLRIFDLQMDHNCEVESSSSGSKASSLSASTFYSMIDDTYRVLDPKSFFSKSQNVRFINPLFR